MCYYVFILWGLNIVFYYICPGCIGGVGRGKIISGIGSGAGHGGRGGVSCYNDSCVEGGIAYGEANLPCELGSGSGNDSAIGYTAGGGILGKLEYFNLKVIHITLVIKLTA